MSSSFGAAHASVSYFMLPMYPVATSMRKWELLFPKQFFVRMSKQFKAIFGNKQGIFNVVAAQLGAVVRRLDTEDHAGSKVPGLELEIKGNLRL